MLRLSTLCSRGRARAFGSAVALCVLPLAAAPAALADVSASAPGDIGVSISTPGPVLSGVATTYTVSVTNNAPEEFLSVLSTGTLSNGFTLSGFGLNDNCARSNTNSLGILRGPVFSCVLGTGGSVSAGQTTPPGNILAPGASTSWTFIATAAKPGTYAAHVTASGLFSFGNPLGNGRSNAVDLSIPVGQGPAGGGGGGGGGGVPAPAGTADIALTGSASNGSPALGSQFSYKFQVKNSGRSDASGVTFDDPLPASVVGTSVATDSGTCALDAVTNSVHCDLGTVAAGKQATITVNASAPSAPGAVTNTASSAMAGTDANPGNNSTSITVQPR
jgi:uncharacterized repeat protein (TIGR01451 family)